MPQRNNGDPFNATRQRFHDLRGRLSAISGTLDLVRAEPLSDKQLAHLERINGYVDGLADALEAARAEILQALVLPPRVGMLWVAYCERDGKFDQQVLSDQVDHLRRYHGLPRLSLAIVVALPDLLVPMRAAFQDLGFQVRVATDPADVPFMLSEKPADLIAMAPRGIEAAMWWYKLRLSLQGIEAPPLLHIGNEAGNV